MSSHSKEADKTLIHVAAAFDQNYVSPFCSLLNSLLAHHLSGQLYLHIIAEGISVSQKRKLSELVENAGQEICFYAIDDRRLANFPTAGNWTSTAYYRLLFPELVPKGVERILYIDSDAVVVDSLSDLYREELGPFAVGAVYDNYVKTQPLLGIDIGQYFNSGVLLIEVGKWRAQRLTEKTFQYLCDFPDRILFADQCALNAVLAGNWKQLPPYYNLMYSLLPQGASKTLLKKYVEKAVIVHFTIQRPWHMLCKNRLRYLYFHYLKQGAVSDAWVYSDFRLAKIPAWIKIRLLEFYFDSPIVQRLWRGIKRK